MNKKSLGDTEKLLHDRGREKKETYMYDFAGVVPHVINGTVNIIFVDDKFACVTFPFKGAYTRRGWRILAEIERKITEIEERKVQPKVEADNE